MAHHSGAESSTKALTSFANLDHEQMNSGANVD